MDSSAGPRSRAERRRDTEHRLAHDVDPREETVPYRWFRVTPRRVRAWREADELPGRELVRDGRRLA